MQQLSVVCDEQKTMDLGHKRMYQFDLYRKYNLNQISIYVRYVSTMYNSLIDYERVLSLPISTSRDQLFMADVRSSHLRGMTS